MRRNCVILALALLAGVLPVGASASSYGTELPFAAGTGARASSMGLAGVSLMGQPSLQYFNPGVLGRFDQQSIEFYRTTLFDSDSQYHTLSYLWPSLDRGTFALSLLRLDVGGVEERDGFNNLLGEIKNSNTRVLLGYGMMIHPAIAAGLNLKVDNQSFGDFSGTGIGLDGGLHAMRHLSDTAIFRELRAGIAIENLIQPSVKLDQDDVEDPLRMTFGASLRSQYGPVGFITALDMVSPHHSPAQIRFGQQFDYRDMLALRAGFDGSTATMGVGGKYRRIGLDYAYRSEDLGANHRISLVVAFGGSVSERAAQRQSQLDAEMRDRVAQRMDEFEQAQLRRLIATADSLFNAGDYASAVDQYDLVLVWAPENTRAAERLAHSRYRVAMTEGHSAFDRSDYVAALYQFRQAAAIDPADSAAPRMVSECQKRIDDAEGRSRIINQMLKSAIDQYAEGRYAEALNGFEEVLRVQPDNRLAQEYRHKSQTNINNAVQSFVLKSRAQADRQNFARAISLLEQAAKMAPDDDTIATELSSLRSRQEQHARQALEQRRSLAQSPSTSTRTAPRPRVDARILDEKFEQGIEHFERGDFEEAARELLEVWTVAPQHRNVTEPLTRAYLFLGMTVYSQERYDDAIRIWEKILAIDPNSVKAQRYLQKTREEASKLTGASR